MGWLHAIPSNDSNKQNLSRIALLEATGGSADELDPGPLEFIAQYLFEIGPAVAGESLTFSEMRAWSELTGARLPGWQYQTLRTLSGAYLKSYNDGRDVDCPCPVAIRPPDREQVEDKLLKFVSSFNNSRGAK